MAYSLRYAVVGAVFLLVQACSGEIFHEARVQDDGFIVVDARHGNEQSSA